MAKPTVLYSNMRVAGGDTLPDKMIRLARAAGIEKIRFQGKFVAIKAHFGERGNLAFLRPNYARALALLVRELGGQPFLTDANTLYVGGRRNALDHLETAYQNGFSPFSAGCHVLIADGLRGDDDVEVPIPEGPGERLLRTARLGRAVVDADIILTLSHFKVHEITGIGGAVKNLGMGCGSRAGKMLMHCAGKPTVTASACAGCRLCARACGEGAISFPAPGGKAVIDHARCAGCGRCLGACPADAVKPPWDGSADDCGRKIAEYALAVVRGKPHFHLMAACDITPYCDCHSENDAAVLQDIGLFASADPVAMDTACAEMAVRLPPLPGTMLAECAGRGRDHFHSLHPVSDWRKGLEHAEAIGLGRCGYSLKTH